MRKSLFLIPLLLSSVACKQGDAGAEARTAGPAAPTASASAQARVDGTAAIASADAAGDARGYEFKQEFDESGGGALDFEYSWSASIAKEPALVALLEKDRKARLEEETRSWRESADGCPEDAVACRNYSFAKGYEVVTDLPRFLSISNGFYTYTGGAHGMYGKGSAVWDREAKSLLDPEDLFASQAAIAKAVSAKACAKLDKERMKRRGEVVEGASDGEWPNNCPGMDETTLFLGSSNGKTFDRLGLYYGPYVAGAYAEGEYEIDLPVDAAVIAAVKPEFRPYFSVKR